MSKVIIRSMVSEADALNKLADWLDRKGIENAIIEKEGKMPLYWYVEAHYELA